MQKKLLLRECLCHEKYSWPMTMLSYPLVFQEKVREGAWELKDFEGNAIPFQVTDVRREGEEIRGLILHFLTGLLKGEKKEFCFQDRLYAEERPERRKPETALQGASGMEGRVQKPAAEFAFRLEPEEGQRGFALTHGDKRIVCRMPFERMERRTVHEGAVFRETEIVCSGSRGQKYVLNIRIIAGMPFWELRERMSGFGENEQAQMELSFEGFDFTHRFSAFRPNEKIDAYLDEENKMPVTVMSYENYISWFQSKYISFSGEDCSAGLFIRDNREWDDGKYPIWGANREFGIRFRYEGERVTACFPLKNGKRFTGIAVYGGHRGEYIKELWKWYAFYHLDKVKDWVLDWEEDRSQYPLFFKKEQGKPIQAQDWHYKRGEMLDGRKMTEVIDRLSCSVNGEVDIRDQGMDPVRNREFACWTVIFDLTADEMSEEEFRRTKAMFAFMAYAAKDENYMPTENMLAGHPNFLADTAAVSGFFAALFPHHPQREMFRAYFDRVVALNLRYHIRPDVAVYESLGGRETESLGGYCFAMLRPFVHVCKLLEKAGFTCPLACEKGAKWLDWMAGTMSAPVFGRRTKLLQGAHSRKAEIPYILYEMAQMLEEKYPETAENVYAVCEGSALENFEVQPPGEDIWRSLFQRGENKGRLSLKSEKFTGYGFVLREGVGTPEEISVHIQQLDRGPNYRWGCFENTGNGGIYYFAAGRRYSFNAPEDTGDKNAGAEEGNCGFCVLKGHTYHNIGFQDLTEPLRSFPMVKQAKLMAGEEIREYYKFRRVSLVEKDYIVLFDAVTHMRARGRFLWTVSELEEFPEIWQLRPGADGAAHRTAAGDLAAGHGDDRSLRLGQMSRSLTYDGFGNFLTIVTHRKDLRAEVTEYGAAVSVGDRQDYIFEDDAAIRFCQDGLCFAGKSGILSRRSDGVLKGALLEGSRIGCGHVEIGLEGRGAVCFEYRKGCCRGEAAADGRCMVEINGQKTVLDMGRYWWEMKDRAVFVRQPDRFYSGNGGFVRDTRRHEWGFSGTDFREKGEILTYPEK